MLYHHHPNAYDCMDKLKLIQTYHNLKIRAAERPLPLSTVEKDNVQQMRNIQTQYQNSEISQEFVKLMAYRAQPVINL